MIKHMFNNFDNIVDKDSDTDNICCYMVTIQNNDANGIPIYIAYSHYFLST